jgi:hypothetical protein
VGEPFLRTAAMRWIVVGIVLCGAAAQQYALTWAFDLRVAVGDLLAAVGVAALLVLEITRGYGYRFAWVEAAVCALPLTAMLLVVVFGRYTALPSDPAAALSFPPLFAAAFALAMHVSAWRGGQRSRHGVGAIYLLLAVLLFDVRPDVRFDAPGLSWVGFGYWLSAVLMVWAMVKRWAWPAFASAAVVAVTVALDPAVREWADARGLATQAIGAAAFGLVSLLVYAVARRRVPQWAGFIAAGVLAAAVMHCTFRETALHGPYVASAVTLAVVAACAGWRRELWPMLPGAAPLAAAFYMDVEHKGWVLVAASFVLLLVGAAGSVRKGAGVKARSPVG